MDKITSVKKTYQNVRLELGEIWNRKVCLTFLTLTIPLLLFACSTTGEPADSQQNDSPVQSPYPDLEGNRNNSETTGERRQNRGQNSRSSNKNKKNHGIHSSNSSGVERIYLYLDSEEKTLGAYSLLLTYNAEVAELEEVNPGSAPGFHRPPFTKTLSEESEQSNVQLRITSFQVNRDPSGNSCVATLKFNRKKSGLIVQNVTLETMSTPQGTRISGHIQWSNRR